MSASRNENEEISIQVEYDPNTSLYNIDVLNSNEQSIFKFMLKHNKKEFVKPLDFTDMTKINKENQLKIEEIITWLNANFDLVKVETKISFTFIPNKQKDKPAPTLVLVDNRGKKKSQSIFNRFRNKITDFAKKHPILTGIIAAVVTTVVVAAVVVGVAASFGALAIPLTAAAVATGTFITAGTLSGTAAIAVGGAAIVTAAAVTSATAIAVVGGVTMAVSKKKLSADITSKPIATVEKRKNTGIEKNKNEYEGNSPVFSDTDSDTEYSDAEDSDAEDSANKDDSANDKIYGLNYSNFNLDGEPTSSSKNDIAEKINLLRLFIRNALMVLRANYSGQDSNTKNIVAIDEALKATRDTSFNMETTNDGKCAVLNKILASEMLTFDARIKRTLVQIENSIQISHSLDARQHILSHEASIYPKRAGGEVTFYSDAYKNKDKNSGAFNDLFNSIYHATESIMVTGWTLSHTEKFKFFDSKNNVFREMTLPQLIAQKAQEGVELIILPWKNIAPGFTEATNNLLQCIEDEIKILAEIKCQDPSNDYYLDNGYFLQNSKDLAKKIFKKVHFKFSNNRFLYSDHAKMVIVDSKELYMGGLDLTTGRSDIQTWHDCHCRFVGGTVLDAVELLSYRFRKESKLKSTKEEKQAVNVLDKIVSKAKIAARSYYENARGSDVKNTNSQLFTCLPKMANPTKELMYSQIEAIKKANNFIYMENQYFTGPRTLESGETDEGSNPVIVEIFEKIKSCIEINKPFHFYCQLPFRPEGEPDSLLVNQLLRREWKTIKWFIHSIKDQIDTHNKKPGNSKLQKSVGDYVTFSNLGFKKSDKTTEDGYEMKYTHSKLMIVDDKLVLIGSNNCNRRSNVGKGDHEVCLLLEGYDNIADYRKELMSQHVGQECMEFITSTMLSPGDKEFSSTIKEHINSNLDALENCSSAIATPWGNTPTKDLENELRPPHVPSKTNPILTMANQISRVNNFAG